MYFRKNDMPIGGGSIEGFSFNDVKGNKKMWLWVLLIVVILMILFLVMRSRREKPRFGLKFL